MRSSQTITLFSQGPDLSQRPSTFVASILVHGAVFVLVVFGIASNPRMNDRILAERYAVRHLDLHATEPLSRPSAASKIPYPGPYSPELHSTEHADGSGGKPVAQTAIFQQIAQAAPGPQTLLQPTLPSQMKLTVEIPLPTVMIWSAEKNPVKTIVAPQPHAAAAADVPPSSEAPNKEVNLADRAVSATDLSPRAQKVPPSTTTPLAVQAPNPVQKAPETASESTAQPTPTAVLSLSDLHLKEGTVSLPPVSMTASSSASAVPAPKLAADSAPAGKSDPKSSASGMGAGQKSGEAGNKPDTNAASVNRNQTQTASTPQGSATSGFSSQSSEARIALPRDGKFGAVVVGSSLAETYPETAELWSSRLAYTVYLHVGLAKSWILQYALPRTAEAEAGGSVQRLEAPWPFNIVRPNIDAGAIDADALMVHGFVNAEGRFENLAVAFPPEFAQKQFVLNSLAQWQFRPAAQNGKPVRVEVLLIIPEVEE